MATQRLWVGSVGPLLFDDTKSYSDAVTRRAFRGDQIYLDNAPSSNQEVVRLIDMEGDERSTILGLASMLALLISSENKRQSHNKLARLQGGTTDEYYHLTSAQHTDLTDSGETSLHTHDHGAINGLGDDDHTIYLLADGSRALAGNLTFEGSTDREIKLDDDDKSIAIYGGTAGTDGASLWITGRDRATYPANFYASYGGYDNIGTMFARRRNTAGSISYAQTWDAWLNTIIGDYRITGTTWAAGASKTLNVSWVYPTVPNGFEYFCTAVSGSAPYTTGTDEPTWPTTETDTVVDNEVTWTAYEIPKGNISLCATLNAPNRNIADRIWLWAADQAAGNCALKLQTENGSILTLYQQAHIADIADTAGADSDGTARAAINALYVILENVGLLATS